MPMRIIVWGINYAPEVTGIAPYNTALCQFLKRRGHDVEMVTTFSYYPAWAKRPEDSGRLGRRDLVEGVPVHRCWHYVPARVSTIKRILHEGTFVATSLIRLLTLRRADVYVVVSPPLLLGAAAAVLRRVKRRPFVFHVQDLQPDAAAGLGMIQKDWLMRALYRLEAIAYSQAARVSGIMAGMLRAFREKGVPEEKLLFFPNGVHLPDPACAPARGRFRDRHGFAPNDFLAVYSGNLGVKQGLDVLVTAAAQVRDHRVRIVICGEGSQRPVLETLVRERSLANVTLLPLQPAEGYTEMLVDSDVCLITQQAGSGGYFFPANSSRRWPGAGPC